MILSGILVVVSVNIKKAAHLLTEECEEIIDNKTVPAKKYLNILLDSCKPFFASSLLFLLVSVIIVGLFVYFYVNLQPKRKLKDYY